MSIVGCCTEGPKGRSGSKDHVGRIQSRGQEGGGDSHPALVATHIAEAFYGCKEQRNYNRTMGK